MAAPSLLARLKERKLVQWAVAYAAGAWLLIEVVDVLGQWWSWPVVAVQAIQVVLAIGLPVTLVIAWYHGEKGQQRVSGPELVMVAALLAIAGALVGVVGRSAVNPLSVRAGGDAGAEPGAPGDGDSGASGDAADAIVVAVLPFESLSPNDEDRYFADGIHEEILGRVARASALRVISRTSVLEYRDRPDNVRTIASELGADYVVEGSVRRAGNQLRITAQLIDAATDQHAWANTYERELVDVFTIQSDVAEQIATALDARLSPVERGLVQARGTDNLEAYQLYLRARSASSGDEALGLYRAALALDPDFALAHVRIAQGHLLDYWFNVDPSEERVRLAKAELDRALELDSELPEAHYWLGKYYYWGLLDYDRALLEYGIAEQGMPNEAELFSAIGEVLRRRGDFGEAAEYWRKAFAREPRSAGLARQLGGTFLWMGEYEQSLETLRLASSLRPGSVSAPTVLTLSRLGNVAAMRDELGSLRSRTSGRQAIEDNLAWWWLHVFERTFDEGIQRFQDSSWDALRLQPWFYPRTYLLGRLHQLAGHQAEAERYCSEAVGLLEGELADRPEDDRLQASLGLVLACLGRKEQAIAAGLRAVELKPIQKDVVDGALRLTDLAEVYARVGEPDRAIDQLEAILPTSGWLSPAYLRLDPAWDAIRDVPRFQALLQEYEYRPEP